MHNTDVVVGGLTTNILGHVELICRTVFVLEGCNESPSGIATESGIGRLVIKNLSRVSTKDRREGRVRLDEAVLVPDLDDNTRKSGRFDFVDRDMNGGRFGVLGHRRKEPLQCR
jgi:hypothetical protein